MKIFRVIIAGSRSFQDYDLLCQHADKMLARVRQDHKIIVVSGGAHGADELGELYAVNRGYEIKAFSADWDRYGKSAGYIRNEEMARNADALIAFWDGQSHGTKHMIDLAEKYKLKVSVKQYNE